MLSPAQGVVVGSRYVLTRPLAKGGMGSVWIARHRELDVDVSVKFMMPTLVESAELRGRFEREAKVAAKLRSQHVVQVLDFGIDEGMPYIAMELLQGENLADRLKREARMQLPLAVRIVTQVCKALRTAHEAGLVHRDLKPGNVFLAVKDGEEVVKVLDFGIVKDTAKNDADETAGATETGVMMGSVHYMSPEQIRSSRQVDHRSDLWSIAVILYKMLTGHAPFPGTNQGDVMVRVCTDSCPPPSHYVPNLAGPVDAFFVRALTREPAGRFQSAQEMSDAFVAATANLVASGAAATAPLNKWSKTVPLLPNKADIQAAVDAELAAMQAAQKTAQGGPLLPQERSYVSAVLETAPGTFQAVTMPGERPGMHMGTAIALPPAKPRSNAGLIAGVALAVTALGIILVFFVLRSGAASDETAKTDANSSPSASLVPAPSPPPEIVAPSVDSSPLPTASANSAPTSKTTAKQSPGRVTAPRTSPTPTSTSTRKNPLDIND